MGKGARSSKGAKAPLSTVPGGPQRRDQSKKPKVILCHVTGKCLRWAGISSLFNQFRRQCWNILHKALMYDCIVTVTIIIIKIYIFLSPLASKFWRRHWPSGTQVNRNAITYHVNKTYKCVCFTSHTVILLHFAQYMYLLVTWWDIRQSCWWTTYKKQYHEHCKYIKVCARIAFSPSTNKLNRSTTWFFPNN